MLKIRRVLISVWDKKSIIDFAKKLKDYNVEIISTGKTHSLLSKSGLNTKEVSQVTQFPEILSGRVKTLHPKVFGGVLANKKHPLHLEEIKNLDITPIDMVVVNFYPFSLMMKEGLSPAQMMEYIDIGGPSLLRAGAKNYKNVACISSPSQYKKVADELLKNKGVLGEPLLKELACDVFRLTKEYDTLIYSYLKKKELLLWDLERFLKLRYGENPHQKAALYRGINKDNLELKQLQGKHISFNNLMDLDAAFSLVREFQDPAAVIVKHASPSSVATDKNVHSAYLKAYRADPLSSFGGIVGLNRKVDKKTAKEIMKSGFKECIIAPRYSKEAMRIFCEKRSLRIIETDFEKEITGYDIKRTAFGYLVQEADDIFLDKNALKVVTAKKPSAREMKDLLFAWRVVKYVKSNAVVIAKANSTLGIGSGQPSRVDSVKIALRKSLKSTRAAVIASEAFFPKEDAIKLIKKNGIKAIIQPGGSIMDEKIIDLCNKYNLSMVFTGIRHFRH